RAAGKTTLCQKIMGESLSYKKTQAIEFIGSDIIDTPGEYLEQRNLYRALTITAVDADIILFVLDATEEQNMFAPMLSQMFTKPCIGVITKSDIASDTAIQNAKRTLKLAGTEKMFTVSSVSGQGIEELVFYLQEDETDNF
ncbi:MAG: EutP/PduV family microcompartment system protein, partial [Oscillospiraceae bacterium]